MQQDSRVEKSPADAASRHDAAADDAARGDDQGIIEELLVEEVSIDGKCGVY